MLAAEREVYRTSQLQPNDAAVKRPGVWIWTHSRLAGLGHRLLQQLDFEHIR